MMTPKVDAKELGTVLRIDLFSFLVGCFYELHPGQDLSYAPHLEVIAARLIAVLMGRGPKRLIINLPPRSLKSITVSVAFVAWLLGHDPTRRIICASDGQDLADKHARDTRTLMMSSFYKQAFPRTQLSASKLSVSDYMTTEQGFRMATSVGGVLTGRGADVIIIDDPLKPDEALSETRRNAVNDWYRNTLLSRLNNKEEGIIIIVMQRLHQDDLVGHVLDSGENWEVLSFPAIAEEDECYVVETPLGPFTFKRRKGEVLDSTRESFATLLETKRTIGEYNFASQYQQCPAPPGGAIIKTHWLQYRDVAAPLPRFTTILQSWDTANKSGELNDYSVCTTWGTCNGKFYLLDVYRERLDYPTLKRKVIEQSAKHKPNTILIEDRASGTQLIQDLKSSGVYQVKPYSPIMQSDKIMRLHAQSAKFEGGLVLLPNSAPWLPDYTRELTTFTGFKFDDQVDSTMQALDYLTQNRTLDTWIRLGQQMSQGR